MSFAIFWWFDSIPENIEQISPTLQRDGSGVAKLGKVRKVVYIEAIASDEFNSSVITTVSWALYFAALTFLDRITNSRYAPIIVTFAIAGLILYRLDKSHRPAGETAHGFRFGARISIIAALVVCVLVIRPPILGRTGQYGPFPGSNREAVAHSFTLNTRVLLRRSSHTRSRPAGC